MYGNVTGSSSFQRLHLGLVLHGRGYFSPTACARRLVAGLRGLTSLVSQLENICWGAVAGPWVSLIWLWATPQSLQVVQEPPSAHQTERPAANRANSRQSPGSLPSYPAVGNTKSVCRDGEGARGWGEKQHLLHAWPENLSSGRKHKGCFCEAVPKGSHCATTR